MGRNEELAFGYRLCMETRLYKRHFGREGASDDSWQVTLIQTKTPAFTVDRILRGAAIVEPEQCTAISTMSVKLILICCWKVLVRVIVVNPVQKVISPLHYSIEASGNYSVSII